MSVFDLPARLSPKADPALIAEDERHFAEIGASLERSIAELSERIDVARKAPGGSGQQALERDLAIHRMTSRLRALRRYGLDVCLGRMVTQDAAEPIYVGRFGLTDSSGARLLLDWRSPAAEPFFGATHANPMGLSSRRRYRWTRGRVTDYWDEAFTAEALASTAALDDQSAFIASLGGSRSARMRDVLGTIQADQDAIIRAGSRGALVVDGGPGTGKTVVALHRTAYLLYSDPRIVRSGNGVLFVGPSAAYLSYVDDVLPSLGEDSVQLCTLRGLVREGAAAVPEADAEVARLKSSAQLVRAVDAAVALLERPPAKPVTVETPWTTVRVTPAEWAEAFDAADPAAPHNEAREQVWEALLDIIMDELRDELDLDRGDGEEGWGRDRHSDTDYDADQFDAYGLGGLGRESADDRMRRSLASNTDLARAFGRAWPLVEAADLVARLWSDPDLLRQCAPWLEPEQVAALQRGSEASFTLADLPFLDAARQRLGDPEVARLRRRHEAAVAEERARMSDVLDDLIANDESELGIMKMLRGQDLRAALVDDAALPTIDPDLLAGPFAHVVIDEAQELTDAEWQLILARCPSRSFTIVGDRAQARHGFTESWQERLERVGIGEVRLASLSINYRTPEEVMEEAEPVIRAALPDANVPTSIRRSGIPVRHGHASEVASIVETWLAEHGDGVVCVIGDATVPSRGRVASLTPELAKGLEFDLVVLVDPERFGTGIEGAVDRYVAMTRATQELVVLTS